MKQKPRIAVISPFLDKRHGSERIMIEWLSHLPDDFDLHVYSQRVEDFDPTKFTLHRIPELPGPHLFNFLWWLAANRIWVAWDSRIRGLKHDLVLSSGVNRFGADVICVHIVFREYVVRVAEAMRFSRHSIRHWPRLAHRKLYYAVVNRMERDVFTDLDATLVAYSRKTANELAQFFGRRDKIPVLYLGLDHSVFNPARCAEMRRTARENLGLTEDQFVLLLVGNDWRNKGVPVLLEVLEKLRDLPISLFVISREEASACWKLVKEKGLEGRVRFLPPRNDIEFYYAAADTYVGPSLQDSYSIPPAEAMACGLPVIVSAMAGVSEIVSDGKDGFVLRDPKDAVRLASIVRSLYDDEELRKRLGEQAAQAAQQYTWERNGRELAGIFREVLQRKCDHAQPALRETRGSATR